jgi:hypothetical protein
MKLPWRGGVPNDLTIQRKFSKAGVFFVRPGSALTWMDFEHLPVKLKPVAGYLQQLINEGRMVESAEGTLLSWRHLYEMTGDEEHASSLPLLGLPTQGDWRPILISRSTPSDPHFSIAIESWKSAQRGSRLLEREGGLLTNEREAWLTSDVVWRLCEALDTFGERGPKLSSDGRLHELGKILSLAVAADASLDDYLSRTHVISPEKISIEVRQGSALGAPVIELIPRPEGVPPEFVRAFDQYESVRSRYDVTQPDGGVAHIAPSDGVKAILEPIKRLPGRRLASEEARIFVHNPYAVLGEGANALDENQFIEAREKAALLSSELDFVPTDGSERPYIQIASCSESEQPKPIALTSPVASELLNASARSRARGLDLFVWEGHEISLTARTERALSAIATWLGTQSAQALRFEEIMCLDAYSDRVTGFDARVQTVPYVALRDAERGWVPDNVHAGIAVVDRTTGAIRHIPMPSEQMDTLRERVAHAKASGAASVQLPDSDIDVSVNEAEGIVESFQNAHDSIAHKQPPRPLKDPKSDGKRALLQIFHNIEKGEYGQAVPEGPSTPGASETQLPSALRSDVNLLPHQKEGLAWLLQRYALQAKGISGCLLADDMGLGKTLQALCLIAWHHENGGSAAAPCLIVAPVSLLENWKLEIAKFLAWSATDVLSLYGDELSRLRAKRSTIDPRLLEVGVSKLLTPTFHVGYKIVLTTYETLRDYEFSLARVHWGVVVCDEAQKIKNPAAFVTQAAKALRADFRVACTGTPVENSLADLWCLFDFFQPGHLGFLNEFTATFRRAIETRTDGHEQIISRLRGQVEPWILRRMKTDVHSGLPRKIEGADADESCDRLPMSPLQSKMYADAISSYRSAKDDPGGARSTLILALLTRLRAICANPMAIADSGHELRPVDEHLRASPKLRWLLDRLRSIKQSHEKAIVFTEFRGIQRLLQRAIAERLGYTAQIINGGTTVDSTNEQSRQRLIDAFQRQPGFGVIILSTTAVGFGVNVQAANHVIHFTRPWNPAKEDQATDRAYRIGQTKDVYVYCPTVVGAGFESFEQRLASLLREKRKLSRDILSGSQDITAEELLDLG